LRTWLRRVPGRAISDPGRAFAALSAQLLAHQGGWPHRGDQSSCRPKTGSRTA